MKKKLIALTASFALAASAAGTAAMTAFAENDDVTVIVNGETIDFTGDQAPVIVDERTLVPFRAVFEKMGADVEWYADTQTCEATYGSITVTLTIGENVMYIGDGTTVTVDVPAQIINDRTMVPIRVISEGIGAVVGWDNDTYTVTVNSPEITDSFPTEVNTVTASKGITNEANGLTITFDYPVVTDEFTASMKLNNSISDDIISVAEQAAANYTGDLTKANITYEVINQAGLLEVNYIINNQEIIYSATYSIATGSKIDESYLSEIYGDGMGYRIFVYMVEEPDGDGHIIKAYAEYPYFDENSEIISSLNTQFENSAKKSVDEYVASKLQAADKDGENSFTAHCNVGINDDNIAEVAMDYVEVTNGEKNETSDLIKVNLTTGEVLDTAAANED